MFAGLHDEMARSCLTGITHILRSLHTRRPKPRPRQMESQVLSTFSFSYLLALNSLHFAAVHNKMIISNSAGPINQALDRGRSFARIFGGEIKGCSVCSGPGLCCRDLRSVSKKLMCAGAICGAPMDRSELLALVDSTLVGSLYIVRLLSVTRWICLDAAVCANPDIVRALMPVSKSFRIVSFRGSRLRRGYSAASDPGAAFK